MNGIELPVLPLRTFSRFRMAMLRELIQLPYPERVRIISERWKTMPDEERAHWKAMYKADLAIWEAKMEELNRIHGKEAVSKLVRKRFHTVRTRLTASDDTISRRGAVLGTLARRLADDHNLTFPQALFAASQICVQTAGLSEKSGVDQIIRDCPEDFANLEGNVRLSWRKLAKIINSKN